MVLVSGILLDQAQIVALLEERLLLMDMEGIQESVAGHSLVKIQVRWIDLVPMLPDILLRI